MGTIAKKEGYGLSSEIPREGWSASFRDRPVKYHRSTELGLIGSGTSQLPCKFIFHKTVQKVLNMEPDNLRINVRPKTAAIQNHGDGLALFIGSGSSFQKRSRVVAMA
jgi:hypothetical protein